MEYKQIFKFSDFYLLQEFAFPFIPFLIFLWIAYALRTSAQKGTEEYKKYNRNFIGIIFMLFFLLFGMSKNILDMIHIKQTYDNKEYSIAEGRVTSPVKRINNSNNRTYVNFTINDVEFAYYHKIFGACFSRVKSNQKRIDKEGQELKIYYVGSCIVEVWIK